MERNFAQEVAPWVGWHFLKYEQLEKNIENWSPLDIVLAGLYQLELCNLGYVP